MGWIHSHINDLFLQIEVHYSAEILLKWDVLPGRDYFSRISKSLEIAGDLCKVCNTFQNFYTHWSVFLLKFMKAVTNCFSSRYKYQSVGDFWGKIIRRRNVYLLGVRFLGILDAWRTTHGFSFRSADLNYFKWERNIDVMSHFSKLFEVGYFNQSSRRRIF